MQSVWNLIHDLFNGIDENYYKIIRGINMFDQWSNYRSH